MFAVASTANTPVIVVGKPGPRRRAAAPVPEAEPSRPAAKKSAKAKPAPEREAGQDDEEDLDELPF